MRSLINALILVLYIFILYNTKTNAQVSPGPYKKISMPSNSTIAQGAWGMDVDIPTLFNQPRYDLSLWSTIAFPSIMTPCSYMYPLTISVKNLNYTFDSNPIIFSCNSDGLSGSMWISTALGQISVNQTSTYYAACNIIAKYLTDSTPTMIQTSSATNFTFLLPGLVIKNAMDNISLKGISLGPLSDPNLNWLQQHFYSLEWIDVGSTLNLASQFTDMVIMPLIYEFQIPSFILPNSSVIGLTSSQHYYRDLFNLTLTRGSTRFSSYESSGNKISDNIWKLNSAYAGFHPPVTQSVQGAFIAIENNVTEQQYNSAVPFGWTNTAIGISPIKVVLPSNLPLDNYTECLDNYLFYYPMNPYWNNFENNTKKSIFNLKYILNNNTSILNTKMYSRNTIQTSLYFSKRPWLNAPEYPGQLNGTLVTYLTFSNNFLGGCYYNGTFPYFPTKESCGSKVGYCGSQIFNTSTQFNSPYYLPPMNYLSSPSPFSYFFTITSLIQFANYRHIGSIKTDINDNDRSILGYYPGNGISHSLLLASCVNYPSIAYTLPTFINPNYTLKIGSSFYQFNQKYINRNYGFYASPGSGMSCRAARFIPQASSMESVMISWECKRLAKPINQTWIEMALYPRIYSTSCASNSSYVSCLNELNLNNQYPGMINNASDQYITYLKGGDFNTSSSFIISQTLYTDTMAYTTPSNNWISEKVFAPPYNDYSAPQYCISAPIMPVTPTNIQQVFMIYPTIKPWDHIHNTPYSFVIPFGTEYSIRYVVSIGNLTGIDRDQQYNIQPSLYCEGVRKINGNPNLNTISINDIINQGNEIVLVTQYPSILVSKFSNCLHTFIISNETATTTVSYETIAQYTPKAKPGIYISVEFGAVDYPPTIGRLTLLPPNSSSNIGDAIYLILDNVVFSNPEQDDAFPSSGIIASSSQIISNNSTVLFLGDSLNQLPSSIRLPAITNEWYVYVRVQTVSNSGCYIPCKPPIGGRVYSHWCTSDLTLLSAFPCPFGVVKMALTENISDIENIIAVVTHQLAYTSIIEVLHMTSALFHLPTNISQVWNTYFDQIYTVSIEQQTTPYSYDYAGSKLITLDIIRQILETAYNNPELDIDTIRPFKSLMNITLNAECTNNPGMSNLILDIVDLLIATNGWDSILNNYVFTNIIVKLIESVGNRFSFWSSSSNSYTWKGSKSNLILSIITIDQFLANKPTKINNLVVGNFALNKISSLFPTESIYFHAYPQEYEIESLYNVSLNCPNYTATILSVNYPTSAISSTILYNSKQNLNIPTSIGFSTLYLCSIDYYSNNFPTVTFTLPLSFEIPVNASNLLCASEINGKWNTSLCSTTISPFNQEAYQFVIECSCSSISPYSLIGNVVISSEYNGNNNNNNTLPGPIPIKIPPMANPWSGFSGSLHNLGITKQMAMEVINSSYAGFLYIDNKVRTSHIPETAISSLDGNSGLAGLYTETGRSQTSNNVSVTWGINAGEAWYKDDSTQGGDANIETFLSWEPSNTNNNPRFLRRDIG
ncbi:hypothetical protein cand_022460 [Cryptosporidium andersoni]|uniref:Uncharacterized protein n=1 Tax=Cryptosporidium andersoni TaxID=117008 RepID=A0A1J4MS61_9CRYT|nr:hypothetical protein cand_022460 [Cryptosporidium andersoni]